MKTLGYIVMAVIFGVLFRWFAFDPNSMKVYNSSGLINQTTKTFADKIAITSANQTFSYSSAGFSKVLSISAQPQLNTTTASSVPLASIQSYNTTSVTVNFIQSNSQTISILGTVSVGLQSLQSFSGDTCQLIVVGY